MKPMPSIDPIINRKSKTISGELLSSVPGPQFCLFTGSIGRRARWFAMMAVVIGACGLSGCASIVDGRTPEISINSSPEGAQVTIYDKHGKEITSGKTPMIASLKRSNGYFAGARYRVLFELEGYQKSEAAITPSVNGWYIGNIFLGGLIGMLIVDPATGAMWTLHPQTIEQHLDKDQSALIEQGDRCPISLVRTALKTNESLDKTSVHHFNLK
jgi:hypothetical protein